MLIGKPEQTDWIKVNINNASINRRTARLLKYDFSSFLLGHLVCVTLDISEPLFVTLTRKKEDGICV